MLKTIVSCLFLANLAVGASGNLSCDDVCTTDKLEIYGPICGSDGITYSTRCAWKKSVCKSKKTVSLAYRGKCKYSGQDCLLKIPCHQDKAQLCASDGKPYYNECAMRKHACKEKKAKVGVKLGIDCSRCPICKKGSGIKVCGSDHKTYASLCELRVAACKQRKAIIVLRDGACEGKPDKPNDGIESPFSGEDVHVPDEDEDEEDNDIFEDDDQD